jgi:hypothetical protein
MFFRSKATKQYTFWRKRIFQIVRLIPLAKVTLFQYSTSTCKKNYFSCCLCFSKPYYNKLLITRSTNASIWRASREPHTRKIKKKLYENCKNIFLNTNKSTAQDKHVFHYFYQMDTPRGGSHARTEEDSQQYTPWLQCRDIILSVASRA